MRRTAPVVVVGAGFSGLAAAYELAKNRVPVTLVEAEPEPGGLAGSFTVGGARLEKFYHHWFTSDTAIMDLAREVGAADRIVTRGTRTGMYYANRFHRLSNPWDLLRLRPLPFWDRLRLARMVLRVRGVGDWRPLDSLTAEAWVRREAGDTVFRVMWEPLLLAKFGQYAGDVSAVWLWSKLKLRGGSRGPFGGERLAYYRGGFAALADALVGRIREAGGRVLLAEPAVGLVMDGDRVVGVNTVSSVHEARAVIWTPAPAVLAELLDRPGDKAYADSLRRIDYLGNVCLVLELDRSLTDLYWINVDEPGFPFVGIIAHTNFDSPSAFAGRHIVYLSRYAAAGDPVYQMSDDELLDYATPWIERMFPAFRPEWILGAHVWRARYAQPVMVRGYRELIPARWAPLDGLLLATMAQVYPEDRGTNYAVREGRAAARELLMSRREVVHAG